MEKTRNIPWWVYLAFSSIQTRKGALLLVWANLALCIYCFPWPLFLVNQGWVVKLFVFKRWLWFVMMVPAVFWYWLSLRWVDRNCGWGDAAQETGMDDS